MPTIYDVARLAAVSPATVSRVLNERDDVNPEMVRRVRESVAMLGYRPNVVARNLRRKVASVWALIISDIENPHFTALVRGVEDVARANGYSVVLCNSDEMLDKERGVRRRRPRGEDGGGSSSRRPRTATARSGRCSTGASPWSASTATCATRRSAPWS